MREHNPRKIRQIVTSRAQRELKAEAPAEVRTKKCPKPGASTLWHRENDNLTAGQLACAAAEVATSPARIGESKSRPRPALAVTRKRSHRWPWAFLVSTGRFRLCPSQRFRCNFDRHSAPSEHPRTPCIRLQTELSIQAIIFGGVLASTHRWKRGRHVEDGSLASLKTGPNK